MKEKAWNVIWTEKRKFMKFPQGKMMVQWSKKFLPQKGPKIFLPYRCNFCITIYKPEKSQYLKWQATINCTAHKNCEWFTLFTGCVTIDIHYRWISRCGKFCSPHPALKSLHISDISIFTFIGKKIFTPCFRVCKWNYWSPYRILMS